MPRATPAAGAAPNPTELPADALAEPVAPQPQAAQDPPVEAPKAAPAWGNWVYTGPPGRIYTAVPVTVNPGDVIRHPGIPAADGCWQPTDAQPTKQPDNYRPDTTPKEG